VERLCELASVFGVKLLTNRLIVDLEVHGGMLVIEVHVEATVLVSDILHVIERNLDRRCECAHYGVGHGPGNEAAQSALGFGFVQPRFNLLGNLIRQAKVEDFIRQPEADFATFGEDGRHFSSRNLGVEGDLGLRWRHLLCSRCIWRARSEEESQSGGGEMTHDQSAKGRANVTGRRVVAERGRMDEEGAGREVADVFGWIGRDARVAFICVSWRVAILWAA